MTSSDWRRQEYMSRKPTMTKVFNRFFYFSQECTWQVNNLRNVYIKTHMDKILWTLLTIIPQFTSTRYLIVTVGSQIGNSPIVAFKLFNWNVEDSNEFFDTVVEYFIY